MRAGIVHKPELLHDSRAALGESPVWDARAQTLFWVDILNHRVHANAGVLVELDELVTSVVPRAGGGLVLTKRFSFASLSLDPVRETFLASLADEPEINRFNDGKCDPRGRFLAGTMHIDGKQPTGSLYSFDGKTATKLLTGATISNGMTWSPDFKTFYYIDSPTRRVMAFDYDLDTSAIANPRAAVRVSRWHGSPDGMTSDTQGNLWIAMWGGAQITKWDPKTGRLLERFPVPAKQPSSCAFGGRNMNELYITSARAWLDERSLRKYPLSGGVFRLETDVEGMPAFEFAG